MSQPQHICPSCGYEYESWVEVCPDCNVPIVTRQPEQGGEGGPMRLGDKNPQWTVVTNVPNALIGNIIKKQLEDAGIPVLLMRSNSADIAEFSHNDFVPHDLRVPRSMLREARELIDSAPSHEAAGPLGGFDPWQSYNDSIQDEQGENEASLGYNTYSTGGGLPEGWQRLPSEADIDARLAARRRMERTPEGWEWSQERKGALQADPERQDLYDHSARGDTQYPFSEREYSPFGPGSDRYTERERGTYGHSTGQPKWVRVVYAILMLAMSMPFIFQLLQQLWNMGRPR